MKTIGFVVVKMNMKLHPSNVLEIGVGNNFVSDYLKRAGINVLNTK